MKSVLVFLGLVAVAVCAGTGGTMNAGYWYYSTSDCTSIAETDVTFGEGLEEGSFFPTNNCVGWSDPGYYIFNYLSHYYNFTCNATHINYWGYYDSSCSGSVADSGSYTIATCATDLDAIDYDCVDDWPNVGDFDDLDILSEYGYTIDVSAAINYFNDTTCGNVVGIVGAGYPSCEWPYHYYCDGGDFYAEYCTNFNLDCGSGCTQDGIYSPAGPLVDGTCYTAATLPDGWDYPGTGEVFFVYLDSYYQSSNLLFCEDTGGNAVATTASFALVAAAAALAL
jgi:hypothetical protein